jgi:hypothetical protein
MHLRLTHIWTWLAHESTVPHLSIAISILAFLVAAWSGYQAKRNASAVESQASTADRQLAQSLADSSEAKRTAEEARKISLHGVNAQTMERSARVCIGTEELKWPPILLKDPCESASYPRTAKPDQAKHISYRHHRFDELYFWVRGIILNVDTRPIQFIPFDGICLIEGESTLLGKGKISIPPKLHPAEGRYLIAPGETALFEWRATHTVRQWMDVYNEEAGSALPKTGILVFPAGDPESSSYIEVELEVRPLRTQDTDDEEIVHKDWEIEDRLPGCVEVKPPKMVHSKAMRQLALALDESAWENPRLWDLEPWQRDLLDLW